MALLCNDPDTIFPKIDYTGEKNHISVGAHLKHHAKLNQMGYMIGSINHLCENVEIRP